MYRRADQNYTLDCEEPAMLAELIGRLGHDTRGRQALQHVAANRDAEIARRLSELAGP